MFSISNLPIRQKLSLIVMAAVLFAVFSLSSVFIAYEYFAQKNSIAEEFSTSSKIIANQSQAAIAFSDIANLHENLDSLMLNQNVVASCLYNEEFELLASKTRQSKNHQCPDRPSVNAHFFDQDFYYRAEPITVDGERKGLLFVQVSLESLYHRLETYVITMFVFAALISIAVYFLSGILQKYISTPLLLLQHTASQVAKTHDYSLQATKVNSDEVGDLVDAFNSMLATIKQQNDKITEDADLLEQKIAERTGELASANSYLAISNKELDVANKELEAFSYSVSHDLRSPLRAIDGFTKALQEDYGDQFDSMAENYMQRIRTASQKMGMLISTLLQLSRVSRKDLEPREIDFSAMCRKICDQLQSNEPNRQIEICIEPNISVYADIKLLEVALDNLIGNAWKYSIYETLAKIDIGCLREQDKTVYFVKDNGAGFDKQYAHDLFTAFKRLHSTDQFEGTGIGLATVSRIIHRHHGDIWATSTLDEGACFYFTLNDSSPTGVKHDAYAGSRYNE